MAIWLASWTVPFAEWQIKESTQGLITGAKFAKESDLSRPESFYYFKKKHNFIMIENKKLFSIGKISDNIRRLFQSQKSNLFPKEIILEVTNNCNLRCRHCHFHARTHQDRRALGFMDQEIWERVLDELKGINHPVTIVTHGAGEPLLHKQLFELLGRIKENPMLSVGFLTNGMLLDKSVVDKLVDLQIDFVAFSVDGTRSATNDFFRVHANLTQIEANIDYLVERKIKRNSQLPRLQFNMVGYPEILDQEMSFVKRWLPVAHVAAVATFKPIGSRKLWSDDDKMDLPVQACPNLWNQLVISHNGDVALCCEDFNVDVAIGSVLNNSIHHIYNHSKQLLAYRKKHIKKDFSGLKLCQDCHFPMGDTILEKKTFELDGMSVNWQKSPAFSTYTKA